MLRLLLTRTLTSLLVLWLVSVLAFILLFLSPGDPARLVLSATGVDIPTPEMVAAKRAELGLDAPPLTRYATWLRQAVNGDFGLSYRTGRPTWEMYAERFPATLLLAGVAVVLTLLIAVPLGVVAAARRGGVLDGVLQGVAVLGAAAPGFWVALVLMLIFAATLRWLPALGSPTLNGIILPAVVLALPNVAVISRLVRAATIDALEQTYMTTARGKGYSQSGALLYHALPNAMVAVLTAVALELAYLLTGTVVVETVFSYPGVGRLAVDAALVGDLPVLVLCVLMAAVIYLVCNWLADLGMILLDPRIRTIA
jgi:peptide/nickel transport system permease protein